MARENKAFLGEEEDDKTRWYTDQAANALMLHPPYPRKVLKIGCQTNANNRCCKNFTPATLHANLVSLLSVDSKERYSRLLNSMSEMPLDPHTNKIIFTLNRVKVCRQFYTLANGWTHSLVTKAIADEKAGRRSKKPRAPEGQRMRIQTALTINTIAGTAQRQAEMMPDSSATRIAAHTWKQFYEDIKHLIDRDLLLGIAMKRG